MSKVLDEIDELIALNVRKDGGSYKDRTEIELKATKLLIDSIDRFNRNSGKLSWLMIGVAGLQVVILLGQIFKWW